MKTPRSIDFTSHLSSMDKWEPRIHAWAFLDRDSVREQARHLDQKIADGSDRGPLHGCLIGIKDIIDVAGMPTGNGSPLGADRIAEVDAPVVARLRQAGAIIVGKTVTTPYAWIDPPPTRNPHNLDRTPGGSSTGSAAALACGMIWGALGTQTGGSIIRPAAFCGVVGLKPTYGRLPVEGILPLAPSLDHPGPMARTVEDVERLWHVLAGPVQPGDQPATHESRPLRLGRIRGPYDDRAEPVMRAAMVQLAHRLEPAQITIVDALLPFDFDAILRDFRTIVAAEAAAFHGPRLSKRPEAYPPQIRSLIEEGSAMTTSASIPARQVLERTRRTTHTWFEGVDAFVMPATFGPAPDPSTTGSPLFQSPWSFAGVPVVTIPIARTPDGLPLGIQLVGPPGGERGLLRVAARCEKALRS